MSGVFTTHLTVLLVVAIATDLSVVGIGGTVGDDAAWLGEQPARLVTGRRGRSTQHGQASPADYY